MTRGLAAGGSFLWRGIQSTVCCLQPSTLGHISFCTVAQHHEGAMATWPSLCLLLLAVPRPAAARVSLQEEQFSSFPPCASCERISSAFAAPELRAAAGCDGAAAASASQSVPASPAECTHNYTEGEKVFSTREVSVTVLYVGVFF